MSKSIKLNSKQIEQSIALYQRTPFQELLASYLKCAPSLDAIKSFAEEHPDRYFKALQSLTPLAGFKETITHEHNHLVEIHQMSDSEVKHRLTELQKQLTLEGEYERKDSVDG